MTRRHSVLGELDRAARMGDAGIVDEDGDGAERGFRRIERAPHRSAIEHVGFDRQRPAAGRRDLILERDDPVLAPRDQRDRRAVRRQHLGKAQPEPARGAGDEADPA